MSLISGVQVASVPFKVVPLVQIPGGICSVVGVIPDELFGSRFLIRVHHADVIVPKFINK